MIKKCICFSVLLLVAGYAQAQEGVDSVKTYYLEGTTTTATRTSESVIEVPMSVTSIEKKNFENSRGYGLNDALINVPGVLIQARSGNQDVRVNIRGFGARGAGDRSNAGTSRGIKVIVDGVSETEPDGRTSFDLVDPDFAERIEIVRSNASSIWGNAGGGVINISTIPQFEKYFGEVQHKRGSFGFTDSKIKLGYNFGNSIAYAGLGWTNFDGYRANSSSERFLVNIGVVSQITPKTTLTAHLTGTDNTFRIPGPISAARYDSSAKLANRNYENQKERRMNKTGRVSLGLDHGFGDHWIISTMFYVNPKILHRSERNTYRDFTRYHLGGNAIVKKEWRVGSDIKNISLIGIDEAYQDGAVLFYDLLNGERGKKLRDNKREGANALGIFAQNETRFHDKINVLIGLRQTKLTYTSQGLPINNTTQDNQNFSKGIQERTFSKVTPKIGISYLFSEKHSVYTNYSTGVEVPAGNETDPVPGSADTLFLISSLLKPIQSSTIEFGTKQNLSLSESSFLRGINYDIAVYTITVKNELIPYNQGRFYLAAGETIRKGMELGAEFLMSQGLSLQSAITLSKNEYTKYTVDSLYTNPSRPGKSADLSKNELAGVPSTHYNVGLKYAPVMAKGGFIEISANGVGKYFTDDANKISVPSYQIVNATLGLGKPLYVTKNIFVKGFLSIRNLMNKKYIASSFINPDYVNGVPNYIEPGLPRNFVLSVSIGMR